VDFSELTDALVAINGGKIYYGSRCRFGSSNNNNFVTSTGGTIEKLSTDIIGDILKPANSNIATLPTVNSNVGTFGDTFNAPSITVNAKGLITGVTSIPAIPMRFNQTTVKGRFYPATIAPGSGVSTIVADKHSFWPIFLPEGYIPDTLEFEVTTGNAGNVRVGVYAHNTVTGGPGLLIQDSGPITTLIAQAHTVPLVPTIVGRSVVWVSMLLSAPTAIRSGTNNGSGIIPGASLQVGGAGFTIPTAFGVLPANVSASTFGITGDRALMALYKA
jgi:hypothetical protein